LERRVSAYPNAYAALPCTHQRLGAFEIPFLKEAVGIGHTLGFAGPALGFQRACPLVRSPRVKPLETRVSAYLNAYAARPVPFAQHMYEKTIFHCI
jgi:hypothetical protein